MRTEEKGAASSYKASAGLGADSFRPNVPLNFRTERCWKMACNSGKCKVMRLLASTLLSFLIPKNVTSERPIALLNGAERQ